MKSKKQSYFNTCWDEFKVWFKPEWKAAWEVLKDAIIVFLSAIKSWLWLVISTFCVGIWKLVVKPIFGRAWAKLMAWINRI